MTTEEQKSNSLDDRKIKGSVALFLETHDIPADRAKNLAVWVGTAILVGLGIIFFVWRKSHAAGIDEDAARDLFSSRAQTQAGLDTLMERCSSSKLAPLIMMKQAQVQYSERNYDLAASTYERFIKMYPTHELATAAELGGIFCKEARQTKEDLESSLQGFTGFAAKHPDSFLCNEATFGRARCLEQLSRFEEARQIYEDFKVAHPSDNVWQERADANLKIVESELRRSRQTKPLTDTGKPLTTPSK